MKEGRIVYLSQFIPPIDESDEPAILKNLGLEPRWTVFVSDQPNYFDVQEALHVLVARGAVRVNAHRMMLTDKAELRLHESNLRLLG
jgi:hypothetical protein